jgi:hypothetical protein
MTDTRALFERMLAGEPPLALTLEPVVTAGRRVRRHRRMAYGACVLSLAGVTAAAAVPLTRQRDRLTTDPPAASPTPARQAVDPSLTSDQRAVARAVVDASPAGWTFDFAADRWDRYDVDATADDGYGRGELGVTLIAKWQHLHPCNEAEGAHSVPCTERALPDGSVLATRTYPHTGNPGGSEVEVILAHPDGSGVRAASTNFWLTWPEPKVKNEAQRAARFHVTRSLPVYTGEQLATVVLALDRAVRETPIVLSPGPGQLGPPLGTTYPVGS